jgi:hypothetical protein
LSRIDIEALFPLALPLLDLPEELVGRCRLSVEVRPGPQPEYAGATVTVEAGRPLSLATRLEGSSDARAIGTTGSWLDCLSGRCDQPLDLSGDSALARAVVEALRQSLFPRPRVALAWH